MNRRPPSREPLDRQSTIELLRLDNATETANSIMNISLGHAESSGSDATDDDDDEQDSIDSLSGDESDDNNDPLLLSKDRLLETTSKTTTTTFTTSSDDYMASREMTPFQEQINAMTMIPNPLYCLYYIWSGCWISQALVQEYRDNGVDSTFDPSVSCYSTTTTTSWLLPIMSLPPATILAVLLGVSIHAPFSFLYHWKYAFSPQKTSHWSRRMDHSMIHVASMCFAYASSGGSWNYTMANVLYNMDCVYRQFQPKVCILY